MTPISASIPSERALEIYNSHELKVPFVGGIELSHFHDPTEERQNKYKQKQPHGCLCKSIKHMFM